MDRLSKVMYINLDHRTDRKKEIEDELKNVFKYNNAERLNATLHEHPILGCTYSHVRIWRRMIEEGWDSVLVIEDDAKLQVPREELDGYINAFLDDEKADMLHLGNSSARYEAYPTKDLHYPPKNRGKGDANHMSPIPPVPESEGGPPTGSGNVEVCACTRRRPCNGVPFYTPRFLRAIRTQSSSCYVLKRKMVMSLLRCYFVNPDDMFTMEETDPDIGRKMGWIDISWNDIIEQHNYLIPNVPPYARIVVQRAGYSDISRKFVDYKL